jgi:two-component system chemotaxis response regulator CheY
MKTLVVDDDVTCRLILQMFFSRYGECHMAENGRKGIEAFSREKDAGQRYNLICLDIMMPEVDGHTVLRAIRASETVDGIPVASRAKIIMTTSRKGYEDIVEAREQSCDAYLIKPVEMAKLPGLLQSLGSL